MWILIAFAGLILNILPIARDANDGFAYLHVLHAFAAGICFSSLIEAIIRVVRT